MPDERRKAVTSRHFQEKYLVRVRNGLQAVYASAEDWDRWSPRIYEIASSKVIDGWDARIAFDYARGTVLKEQNGLR